jgi:uncharacterized protein with HEPN domain
MRSDHDRLLDILEAVEKLEQYSIQDRTIFNSDEKLQVWVIHFLQMIGEAAIGLSDQIRLQHPEVQWGKIIGMRHVLVHGYFDVDLDIVWQAVVRDIPALKFEIEAILKHIDAGG